MALADNREKIQALLAGINALPEAGSGDAPEPVLQEKTVTPTTSSQSVTPDSGYDGLSKVTVNAMPTATQATPSISVSTSGLITASATQSAGYVSAGTKSATKQLTAKAAQTYTPGTADQTIASGQYLTGDQTIKGDANLAAANIKSGVTIFNILGTFAGEGGGGTGGLPDGVEKLATGSYTPTVDYTSTFTVTHNFGQKPNFALLMLGDDVSAEAPKGTKLMQIQFFKNMMTSSTLQTMRGAYLYCGTSGSISTGGISGDAATYVNTTTVGFMAHSSYPLKTGRTYRWLCAVMKDVSE